MKRDGFQYENEVRIAMLLSRQKAVTNPVRHLHLHRLPVATILIDPYLQDYEAEPLKQILQKLAPKARIRRSGFNTPPLSQI